MKKLIAPSFLLAALCGYLALFTPDWKSELHAQAGLYPLDSTVYKGGVMSTDIVVE